MLNATYVNIVFIMQIDKNWLFKNAKFLFAIEEFWLLQDIEQVWKYALSQYPELIVWKLVLLTYCKMLVQ